MLTSSSALPWPAPDVAANPGVVPPAPQAEWKLTRRCSATPCQMVTGLGVLGLVSLFIGLGFWSLGAGPVLVFSGLEIVMLFGALWVHARHACDGDTVALSGRGLSIESRNGVGLTRTMLGLDTLRVLEPADVRAPVRIVARGAVVEVGGQVPFARRLVFARELRQAIDAGRSSGPRSTQIWS